MSISLRPDITLHERRCYECGKWWACEQATTGICPMCGQSRLDRVLTVQDDLRRSNSALRGALKRRKR